MKSQRNREFFRVALSWAIEFGPIMVFFITGDMIGFLRATGLFVILTALALIVSFMRDRKLALFPLIAGLSVVLFGTLAVCTHNPFFFIIKDTIYNGGFAIAIAIGLYSFNEPILKDLFSSLFHMTDKGWTTLSRRWMVMFALLAITNEVARRLLVPDMWIFYKMCATMVTLAFGFYQLTLSRRERMPDSNKWGMNIK